MITLPAPSGFFDRTILCARVPSEVLNVVDTIALHTKNSRSDVIRALIVRSLVDAGLIEMADETAFTL